MEKIKNWFIKHKKKLICSLVLLLVWLHGIGTASCMQRFNVSADTLPIYYPPSISLNVVSTESERFTLSVMSPQDFAVAPGYFYDSWTVYPDTTGSNFSVSYGANVSSSVRDNSVYSTIQYNADGYLSSYSLYIYNYYSDGFNDTTRVPFTLFSSSQHDIAVTYVVYNPTTKTFERINDVIEGELIGQNYRFEIDHSFSLSYFDTNGLIFFQSIMINQSIYRESVNSLYYELLFESYSSEIQLQYLSNLTNTTIVSTEFDILGSIVSSVDSFLEIDILPNFSFYDILLIALAIPLLIAILKLWLGG